jgi:TPR repeat protein
MRRIGAGAAAILVAARAWLGVPADAAAATSDVAALEQRCLSGQVKDCEKVAKMYREGKGVSPDLARGLLFFTYSQVKPGAKGALVRAAEALEASCKSGSSSDCESAAFMLENGLAGEKDSARAAQLRGNASEAALRPGPDIARAALVYAHACAGAETKDEAVACRPSGAAAQASGVVPGMREFLAHAGTALEASCRSGSIWDCNTVGFMLQQGYGGEKDPVRGVQLFDKACKAGLRAACVNLKDYGPVAAAAAMPGTVDEHDKGCKAGDMRSCLLLGRMYETGQGVERDLVSAIRLYKRVCDGGVPVGCGAILAVYEQDPAAGDALFKQACAESQDCGDYEQLLIGYRAAKQIKR